METKPTESLIPNIAYKDFLKNQKEPKRDDSNYVPFWLKHISYCKSGVNVGGIYISGWLYWHINFFKLPIDYIDEWGNPSVDMLPADFRDNEYYFDYAFRKTDKANKDPLISFGTRRFGKTAMIASKIAHKSFIFFKSIPVLVGASQSDINNITKYFDDYYEQRQDCFSDLNKYGDWAKTSSDVKIAFNKRVVTKGKNKMNPITPHFMEIGDDPVYVFSQIAVRNLEHGQVKTKEELLAGITPTDVFWDEALDENEIIPTFNGFKTVKELQVGDNIIGKNGKETKILEKIDVGVKDIYTVKLSDGREVKACEDHLWEVWDNKLNRYRIIDTKTIVKTCYNYQEDKRYTKKVKKRRYSIDLCTPIQTNKTDLPIDPYYLGLWLGDGDKYSATIYTIDEEIKNSVLAYKDKLGLQYSLTKGNNNIDIIRIIGGNNKNSLLTTLKNTGLYKNKHIPEIYLLADYESKKELLAGLLDTDGTITTNGYISFNTSELILKENFERLCASMGIKYNTRASMGSYVKDGVTKKTKTAYTIKIKTTFNPFKLTRKRERYVEYTNKKAIFNREKVSIDSIDFLYKNQAYCFRVDNEDKLFLAGNYVVTHNCAKYSWEKQHSAVLPAISTKFGKRCTELFFGTGGNIEFSGDAEKAFLTPKESGFFYFDMNEFKEHIDSKYFPYEQVSTADVGLFVPAEMSLEGGIKKKIPLYEYVRKEYSRQDIADLEGFEIEITNWEEATNRVTDFVENEKKKGDSAWKKAQMYYPRQPEDCFLHTGSNPFPAEEARDAKKRIEEEKAFGEFVDLYVDSRGDIAIKESKKQPITKFPFEGGTHDAPTIIYERPIFDNPKQIKYGTYVAGFDGYKIAQSNTTDSVGSCYIFKRKVGITGFQYQIVASLATRPESEETFHEQVLYLLMLYNAELLPEADVPLYNFLKRKNKLNYLADCRNLAEGLVKGKSGAQTMYGLPATPPNKEYYLKKIQSYTHEEIVVGYNAETEMPITIKGVHRIPDPILLEELVKYKSGGNFDRLAAFGHALAWEYELSTKNVNPDNNPVGNERSMNIDHFIKNIKKKDGRR